MTGPLSDVLALIGLCAIVVATLLSPLALDPATLIEWRASQ